MPTSLAASASARTVREVGRAIVELCKPGITRLVLVTTACGFLAAPGPLQTFEFFSTLVGTALVVAGANALNMFLERDVDRFMRRTRTRPLPTGRLSPDEVLAFGMAVALVGLVILATTVSTAAVALALLALISYVLLYTPLKQLSSTAVYVGALPGALPPAIGYAAVTGTLDSAGLCLFLILLVWQIPHFLAISLFRKSEYAAAGHQVMPVEKGESYTRKATLISAVVLLLTTLLPVAMGIAGWFYGALALLTGVPFVAWAARGLRASADEAWAKKLFFASLPHLVFVMAGLVVAVNFQH
ncbi:MAG: heme o synthase [Polyangiaceae bacterium]|nr:heme o synthase [Polyangiaceae bacterium]